MDVSSTVFVLLTSIAKNSLFSPCTPALCVVPSQGIPTEFLDETYCAKTREMGPPCDENCTILSLIVLD